MAIAQLRTGNLEHACASGRATVDLLADQVDSDRGLGFLHTFRDELAPLDSSAVAREFVDYARARLGS